MHYLYYNVEAVENGSKEGMKRIRVLAPLVVGSKIYFQTRDEHRRFEVVNVIHTVIPTGEIGHAEEWYESGSGPYITLREF